MQILKSKKLKKIIIALIAVVFILVSGEIVYFYYILSQDVEIEKADVIVVFAGSEDRVKAGFELVDAGYAPVLIVSPATQNQMVNYKSKYVVSTAFSWIIEDRAQSTIENALFTQNIILNNGFKSVILVTSYYHLPRSFFLLKAVSIGNGIIVQLYGKSIDQENLSTKRLFKYKYDLIYDEFLKFWGSIFELLYINV